MILSKVTNAGDLEEFAQKALCELIQLFSETPLGSFDQESLKMHFVRTLRKDLGITYLFDRKIELNTGYFSLYPERLPFTLFHELTHLWLYDNFYDPCHNARFYEKMMDFPSNLYPIDLEVQSFICLEKEAKLIYKCPQCLNRWYLHKPIEYFTYCGPCFDRFGSKYGLEPGSRELVIMETKLRDNAA